MPTPTRSRASDVGEQYVIEDVETLKVFAEPLRLRLLLEMTDEPKTVKEAAGALEVAPTRLYYHLKILLKHKLLRVAGKRMVSGIEERSYQAVAKSWTMSSAKLASAAAQEGVFSAMFDMTSAELEIALRGATTALGEPGSNVAALAITRLMLSPDEVEEVQRRLDQIMLDFGSDGPVPGKAEYHAVLAAYRLPKPAR